LEDKTDVCVACDERSEVMLEAAALDAVEDILGTIAGVEKAPDDVLPFELNLFAALRGEFRSFVREFLRDERVRDLVARMADPASHVALPGLKRQVAQHVLDAFHDLAGQRLGVEFAAAVEADVGRELEAMYAGSRKAAAGAVGLPADTFSVADANSLGVLERHNLYWIRTNYTRNVRDGIERATAEAIGQGLGRRALAEELRRRLGERFALTDNHWLTIASASLNRTRNVAQVRTYEIAEITHYEILVVNDKRLCPTCEYMDGRVFSVETALSVVNELEAADTPEDVKRLMPWLRWDEARQAPYALLGGRRLDLPRGGADSARANRDVEKVAPLPPYHGRCRCTTVASVETVRRPA
jgi:SPP1 gp7 family putative phage head morphogenesis protein